MRPTTPPLRAPAPHPQDLPSLGLTASSSVVVVTDANVWRWHGHKLEAAFAAAGLAQPLVKVLQPGEGSKSRAVKADIEDWMLANRWVG